MKYSDAQKLLELGLITPEQQIAIIEKLKLSPKTTSRNYLMISFSSLGGLLVLAGIILLVSANWGNIPDLVKQISGVALMLGFWAAGLKLLFGKNPHPIIGESLCLVGAGMWLANIALYGQIYQISSDLSNAIGAWFLGIFLLPWIVRLRGVFVMSIIAGFIWLCCKMEELAPGGDEEAFYFFILAYLTGLSALGVFLSSLSDKTRERFRGYAPLAAWTSLPCVVLMAQLFCYDTITCDSYALVAPAIFVATLLFTGALVWDVYSRARGNAFGFVAAVLFGLFPLVPLVLSGVETSNDFGTTVMMAILFAEGVLAMMLGAIVLRKFYVNVGALMVVFAALAAMIEVIGSLTESGFTLIIAGIFMLVFGYFVERSRRKITAKIKDASNVSNS